MPRVNDAEAPPSLRPVVAVLVCIALLVAGDLISDVEEGVTLGHIAIELTTFILASVGLTALALRARHDRARLAQEVVRLAAESASWRERADRWKNEAEVATRGFVEAVEAEFVRWQLTEAERDVALLLLKGVSLKEIADVRHTAERTVRQQATAVYAKAGVSGRSELASYFLDALPSSSSSSPSA